MDDVLKRLAALPASHWRGRYQQIATSLLGWQYRAGQLKRAADLTRTVAEEADRELLRRLREEMRSGPIPDGSRVVTADEEALLLDAGLVGVWGMLIGLAIENLAKGILVARGAAVFESSGALKHPGHNLDGLVKKCLGTLTPEETRALRILSTIVKWRGRYMIPARPDQLRPSGDPGEPIDAYQGLSLAEAAAVDRIFGRLWDALSRERDEARGAPLAAE